MQAIPKFSNKFRELTDLAARLGAFEVRMPLNTGALLCICVVVLLWPTERACGHPVTRAECTEASEFIRNAAIARDNGQTREAYLGQLRGDLLTIRAYPPELRWFAQDEQDEALLVSAARDVFDDPQPPERHRQAFLARCLGSPAHHS